MGNSSSSPSSRGCTVCDEGQEYVRNLIIHDNPLHDVSMTEAYWIYKSVGKNNFHRFLEFKFKCRNCDFSKIVRTDKTKIRRTREGKKNICSSDCFFEQYGLWHWRKVPKYHYTIDDLITYINDAPDGYNLYNNNCRHYAKYIWDKII